MDIEEMSSRLGLDRADVLDLVHLFISTSLSDLAKIRRGVEDNSPADAASAAHSIKGAAGNLGFGRIADIAKTMEMAGKDNRLDGFEPLMTDLETMLDSLQAQLTEA